MLCKRICGNHLELWVEVVGALGHPGGDGGLLEDGGRGLADEPLAGVVPGDDADAEGEEAVAVEDVESLSCEKYGQNGIE